MRIGHFPQHTRQPDLEQDLKWIASRCATSGGLTEMKYNRDDVRDEFGARNSEDYRVFAPPGVECPMFLRTKSASLVDFDFHKLSPGVPGTKISKPRFLCELKYTINKRKVAHLHTHWDAALQDKETGKVLSRTKRVKYMVNAAKVLEDRIVFLQRAGYAVFVTGDFNYRNYKWLPSFELWYYSPQRIFKRCGLHYYAEGLDYMAWDPRCVGPLRAKPVIIKPVHPGNHGDHPYIIQDFGWKRQMFHEIINPDTHDLDPRQER